MLTYRRNNGRHENGQNYLVNDATIRKVVEIDPDNVRWLEQRLDPAVHTVGNLPFHLTTAMPRCVLHAPGSGRSWSMRHGDAALPKELDAGQWVSLFTTLCGRVPRMRID
ncbi:hypothetical protein ACT3SZ_13330 [Corynebacterium sp. AOP40-9SA-29]|uniref:hypothetical protein n=1 Tax=Corynebacterium sp. AOP40-9SA-29 TaxID=3457677 RepID=UPI004033E416